MPMHIIVPLRIINWNYFYI